MKQFNISKNKTTLQQQVIKKIKRLFRPCLLMLSIICIGTAASSQTTITAVQSGPWNDANTWDAASVPTSADDVIITNGYTVTVSATGAVCSSLTVGVGDASGSGILTFSGTSSLTVAGSILLGDVSGATGKITMASGATLTTGTVDEGDPTFSGIYETNVGTIVLNGTFTVPFNMFQFNNLVINGTVSNGGRNLQIDGNLTINAGATLDLGIFSANRNTTGGIFTITNNATLRIGGGGTIPANFSTHVVGSSSTIEYYGIAQTVASLNSSQNYGNLIISGSGLKEVTGSIGIAGDLTVNAGTFSTNIFTANRTSAGGTLTVANGATLRIAGSGTLPSNFNTHVIGATSTIEYSGTSSQTIATLNSSQKYGNLNIFNSVKTLGGSITVAGTISFGGTPNKLNIGSNTLTLEGNISGSLTGSRNFSGSSSSNMIINGAFNRTLFFDATTIGTTNVLNNLTINHSGNISTLGNDLIVNNNLTFTAGKLAIAARTLTLKGSFINTVAAGLRGGSTSKLIINSSSNTGLSMDQTTPGTTNVLSTFQINSSGQTVTLNNDLIMNSTLTFTAGKLAINGNTLTLNGAVTNTVSGGLTGSSTSNLVVNGAVSPSLSFDQTTPGSTNVLKNLTVNSSGQTVTLSNSLRLTGTYTPTAGTLASGGNLTLASTASATANIAAGSTSGGYITGDVIVERYIPQNPFKGWRLLTSPTSGQSIHQSWQENQSAAANGNPGYGTIITSKDASWSANGFDYQSGNYSMYSYDSDNDVLVPVTSTAVSIDGEPGYFIYIRGNRSVAPSGSISGVNATTLRTKGTLFMGDQPAKTINANKFGMLGNPYPSAIDLRNVATTGGCVGTSFYVWDPKLAGSYGLGGFQTLTPSGANYIVVPGGGSFGASGSVSNTIQSGAAFFVQATGSAGTVTITENSKTSGSSLVFRPLGSGIENKFYINLFAVSGSSSSIADGAVFFFDNNYSNDIDGLDSRKQSNFGENLSILRNNTKLVAERRSFPVLEDTIQLAMSGMKKMKYQLQLFGSLLQDNKMLAFLKDKYQNTETFIAEGDTINYEFTIDNNAASIDKNRFSIVFKPAAPLSLNIKNVNAYQQDDKIKVEWQVLSETVIKEYQVEKSINGKDFTNAAVIAATNASTYHWLDANAAAGANYYRIKSYDERGQYNQTQIVKVMMTNSAPGISIAPNPILGSSMQLHFVNKAKGRYQIKLINNTGQVIYQQIHMHDGGTASLTATLPGNLPGGIYQVEMVSPDQSRQLQKVIIVNK